MSRRATEKLEARRASVFVTAPSISAGPRATPHVNLSQFFHDAFRPFYLGGGRFAAIAIPLWPGVRSNMNTVATRPRRHDIHPASIVRLPRRIIDAVHRAGSDDRVLVREVYARAVYVQSVANPGGGVVCAADVDRERVVPLA